MGAGVAPSVVAGSVDAVVVASVATCPEVVGVVPCAAFVDWDDVVNLCGDGGASGSVDATCALVPVEDG